MSDPKRNDEAEFYRGGESFFLGGVVCSLVLSVVLIALFVFVWRSLIPIELDGLLRFLTSLLAVAILVDVCAAIYLGVDSWSHLRNHRRLYGRYYRNPMILKATKPHD